LVVEVGQGGWAALGHLQVGDLILAIDGRPVANLNAFQAEMKQLAIKKPKSLTLQALRGIHKLYVELQTTWEEPVTAKPTATKN
jgi:S1-C subfamily serine protease